MSSDFLTAAVFCGSSISHSQAQLLFPEAKVCSPIKRGDITKVTEPVICVIDGIFFSSLAISPKEITTALSSGKKIFGSSSMGALRAVECAAYGMVGVGEIFECFLKGDLESDDEVAVAIDEETYAQTSDSLVDIRFFLDNPKWENQISEAAKTFILKNISSEYFPLRDFSKALKEASAQALFTREIEEMLVADFKNSPKQKFLDAVACITEARNWCLEAHRQ